MGLFLSDQLVDGVQLARRALYVLLINLVAETIAMSVLSLIANTEFSCWRSQ